ncbi:MAG TPA: response regulator [Candidatus Polarisedimenticolaceae bacterium]|nr:response regulator [Candidatus Polarisedimenticolaceae bacterium]
MSKSILVADDSITIRKVVELTFAETGIRVESVGSGREALDRIPVLRPDLVLADVVMPEPSGYDVCRAVKASERPVPVLLLAGTFEPFDPERARGAGADGHLIKPFESRTLVERVEALLAAPPASVTRAVPPQPQPAPEEELESVLDDLAASAPHAPESAPAGIETLLQDPGAGVPEVPGLSEADLRRLAELVVSRLAEQVVREVAWEVVPETAERLVRQRLIQLEREEPD